MHNYVAIYRIAIDGEQTELGTIDIKSVTGDLQSCTVQQIIVEQIRNSHPNSKKNQCLLYF